MYYIFTYDKAGVSRQKNQISQIDIQSKYQIWIDLEDPTSEELSQIPEIFLIHANILKQYSSGLKKTKNKSFKKLHIYITIKYKI